MVVMIWYMNACVGSVQLVNENKTELDQDYARIRELEYEGLFHLMEN